MAELIRVEQLVSTAKLDEDDKQESPAGHEGRGSTRYYDSSDTVGEERALDEFNAMVPISRPEDFDVTYRDVPPRLAWYAKEMLSVLDELVRLSDRPRGVAQRTWKDAENLVRKLQGDVDIPE